MAAYGKGQMLGSGINPESFKQDYSGFARAAEIQAQGLANLGQSIGGAIQNFGEAKKEQKKVDAYNKASAKSIEAAITLGKSYEIKGVEETLAPFLKSYNDPNLSPIEKAALLDEGKAMIPNVFGRFDKDQAMAIENARNTAAQNAATAKANNRPLTLAEIAMGQGKQQVMLDPVTGIAKPIVIQGFEDQSSQPSTLGNLPQPLQPYSKTFEEAGAKYGVAPQILAAIAMHETGNGTSSAFRNKNNAMGVSDKSGPIAMASVEESIDKMASLLGEGINKGTGPYANAKTIDDIARVYAPPGAGNDPRNLNQFWTQGVSSNLQKLTQANQAQEPQERVGFIPNEVQAPTGTVITIDEYNAAVKSGQNIEGIPLPDGKFYATKQRPFAPQQGQEIITNADGTTIRSIALGGKAGAVAKAQEQTKNESFRLIQSNIEEAFNRLDSAGTNNPLFAAGNAALAQILPASEVGELAGFYDRINSENSFIKMNQQRASSPTGGSAGSMTEKEWPRYEGRFSPLLVNARKDTIAKSLSLNLLNSFEAVNGTPDDVIKLLDDKKIDQATYDNYVNDYVRNRQIARVNANGVAGQSNVWTKLNKELLKKSTVYEAPASTEDFGISPDAQAARERQKQRRNKQ